MLALAYAFFNITHLLLHCKIFYRFSRSKPDCHEPNSPWPGTSVPCFYVIKIILDSLFCALDRLPSYYFAKSILPYVENTPIDIKSSLGKFSTKTKNISS